MNIKRGGQYENDRLILECDSKGFEVSRTKKYVHLSTFRRPKKDEDQLLHEIFGRNDVFLLTSDEAAWLVDQLIDQIKELEK